MLSLETSLVEWKLRRSQPSATGTLSLGNFLSGMETGLYAWAEGTGPNLGNFLSGMETEPVELEELAMRLPWKLP